MGGGSRASTSAVEAVASIGSAHFGCRILALSGLASL